MQPFLMAYAQVNEDEPRRAAIQIWSDEGPFMRLTVNLEDINPGEWAVWVKTWSENEQYAKEFLVQCPWLEMIGQTDVDHDCTAELWSINPHLLPTDVSKKVEEFMGWNIDSFINTETQTGLYEARQNG